MNTKLDLKAIEQKAYRSTYQDGLWDIYYGLIVICVSIFVYRPESGYSPLNIILAVTSFGVAYSLFVAGKKYLTIPRMGQVVFGEKRKKRRRSLAITLGIIVFIQIILVGVQVIAWNDPALGGKINGFLQDKGLMDLAVASLAAFIVGSSLVLVAFFQDFSRGYYISVLFSLAIFLMIYFNQPQYPIIIGVLIILPGVYLLVRFLQQHPLHGREA
jgi:hypothetical protein